MIISCYSTPDYSDLLGKKFEYFERGPEEYDCAGVVIEIWKRAGICLPINCKSSTDNAVQEKRFEQYISELCVKIANTKEEINALAANAWADLCLMDLITFQIIPRYTTHCGVYVGDGRFVHIMSKISVAREELDNPMWINKIRGFYRYRGVSA